MKLSKKEFVEKVLLDQEERKRKAKREYLFPVGVLYKYESISSVNNKKAKKALKGYPIKHIYN